MRNEKKGQELIGVNICHFWHLALRVTHSFPKPGANGRVESVGQGIFVFEGPMGSAF